MKGVFIGLGSNIGNREDNLNRAVAMIEEHAGRITRASSVYETEPWGFVSKDKFLNMVVEISTRLKTSGLLGRLLMIESLLGRIRGGNRYSSRIIDLDILLYGDKILETASLVIPHPRMHERKFVLEPLAEIAPEIIHPLLKKDIRSLLEECPDMNRVIISHYRRNCNNPFPK